MKSLKTLKEIIANLDMDICIIEKDYAGIRNALEYWGYSLDGWTPAQVKAAVDSLAKSDPYFVRLARDLKRKVAA
jgi:hypothetical protein